MTDAILHRGLGSDAIVQNLRNVGALCRLGHDGTTGGWIVLTPVDPLIAEIAADPTEPPPVFVPNRADEIRRWRDAHRE